MKIVVTGGAGFIGSHVALAYAKEGHDVIVIDECPEPPKNIIGVSNITYIEHTLSVHDDSTQLLYSILPDVISHQAAFSESFATCCDVLEDNVCVTAKIASYCITNHVGMIFASSGSVYGNHWSNSYDLKNPLSYYAASKSAAEEFVRLVPKHVIFRYFNIYGYPWGRGNTIIPKIAESLTRGIPITLYGKCVRDFTSINDVVRISVEVLSRPLDRTLYNVGTGIGTTINDLYSKIHHILECITDIDESAVLLRDSYSIYPHDPDVNCASVYNMLPFIPIDLSTGLKDMLISFCEGELNVTK